MPTGWALILLWSIFLVNPQPAEEEKVEKVEEGVAEVKEEEVPKVSMMIVGGDCGWWQ